jgi:excisionase family DNA binding protein
MHTPTTIGSSVELLDTHQAAAYLTLRPSTLEVWRSSGRYSLKFIKFGRSVKYRRSDLDAWLASRVACSTSEAA